MKAAEVQGFMFLISKSTGGGLDGYNGTVALKEVLRISLRLSFLGLS